MKPNLTYTGTYMEYTPLPKPIKLYNKTLDKHFTAHLAAPPTTRLDTTTKYTNLDKSIIIVVHPYSNWEVEPIEETVLDLILTYGGIDGAHHKQWLLDQIVQQCTGPNYKDWVKNYEKGEEGPQTYIWDTGIAP